MTQRKLYQSIAIRSIAGFVVICWSVAFLAQKDLPGAPIATAVVAISFVWLSSYGVMSHYRKSYEQPSVPKLFDLQNGSWAFLIGDTIVLPISVIFVLMGWQAADFSVWSHSLLWAVTSYTAGVLAGRIFHKLDQRNYRKFGAFWALKSPTKLAHDYIAYPVLFGSFVYLAVPMFFNWSWQTSLVVSCFMLWLFLGLCDIIRGLDPRDLHPSWDEKRFRSEPWYR